MINLAPSAAPIAATSALTFIPTLLIIALAFLVPIVLAPAKRWLALPVVVGEILLGIVFGQIFPELANDQLLEILAEIGFGYLFFIAGTEIDFANLRLPTGPRVTLMQRLRSPLPIGAIIYTLTLLMSGGAAWLIARTGLVPADSWSFLAVTIAPSSLGIIVSVLKESGYANRRFGQLLLVSATIADFGTVLILTVLVSVLRNDGFEPEVLRIGYIFLAFAVLYGVMRIVSPLKAVRDFLGRFETPTSPIKLRFVFLVFLLFLAISEAVEAKLVLGTFMGGVLVSLIATPDDREVIHQIEAIGFGFFIPMFFIMIGVSFDLATLVANWQEALLLVVILFFVALVVKVVPGTLLLRLHAGWKHAFAGGMVLSARLSLLVAAAESGVEVGIFGTPEEAVIVEAAIILLAMLMATLGPLTFNRIMPRPQEDAPPPIVVAGAGQIGLEVARQLSRHGEPVIVIDEDPLQIARARESGFEAVVGHTDRPDDRVATLLDRTEKFVTTYLEPDVNYQVCRFMKSTYATPHIVTEVASPGDLERFERIGVTATNPTLDRTALLVLLTRSPVSYELMTRTGDEQEAHEVVVRNPYVIGRPMREIHLPPGLLVIALRRDSDLIVPNGNTRLENGDFVTVVGTAGHATTTYQVFSTSVDPAQIVPLYAVDAPPI